MASVGEVAAGAVLEPLIIGSVDPARMKTMAAILRDPNPIHYDVEVVQRLGLGERPVNQGPLNMAYLLELVSRFAGGPEAIRRFNTRFLGNVFAEDRVECTGTVTAVDEKHGTVEIELQATVEGHPVLAGSATVALTC